MNDRDKQEFDILRNVIIGVTFVSLCFLSYIEWNKVKDSILQSQLEAEYAYDYACSLSSQIVKRAEYGRNVYISKAKWINCGGFESEGGNFIRPLDVEKKFRESNPYADTLEHGAKMRRTYAPIAI